MGSDSAIRGNGVAVACMLVWATNFPVAAMLLKTWPPVLLAAERAMIGGLVVGLVALAMGQTRSILGLLRSPPALVASLTLAVSMLLFVWGQKLVDPVAAAVIVSGMPIFSLAMGWVEGRERFTPQMGLAIAFAVAGGIVTSLVSSASGKEPSLLGSLAVLVGIIAYVWQTRVMVNRVTGTPDIAKSAFTMLVAGLVTALVAAAWRLGGGAAQPVPDVSVTSLALLVWLGGIAVGASSVLWYAAGRMIGVTVTSMHHNLVPFYVIAMATLTGAAVTGRHVIGALLVIAGAVLAQVPVRPRARAGATGP